MVVTQQSLQQEEKVAWHELESAWPGLVEAFSLDSYIATLRQKDLYAQYEVFPHSVVNMLDQIKAEYGQAALASYHKVSLCRMMQGMLEEIGRKPVPERIHESYADWFSRIIEDYHAQPDSYYDIHRPLWPLRKDIGVCSGRSIPVGGAWVVERRWRPRREMSSPAADKNKAERIGSGLIEIMSGAIHALRVPAVARRIKQNVKRLLGHYDLCFAIHTIERNVQSFNAEHMEQAYRNIANLLKQDDVVWGLYRESWFLDPRVGEISPELAFLAEVPLANGARLYDRGPCSDYDAMKATFLSPERHRRYTSGDYVPRKYCYFWPRDRMIDAFGD